MARLPYVDPAAAPEAVREILARLPVQLNIFKLMAHAEADFVNLLRLGSTILGRQALPARLRELAILRVAALSGARYEWVQHAAIARGVGVREEQIGALERGEAGAPCFDEEERALLRFTDEVVRDVKPSDAAFAAVHGRLGSRQTVELVVAIGFYMLMARLMETAEIDLDPPAEMKIVDAARRR
jgi:AhpD family alkylhydroperoxidase